VVGGIGSGGQLAERGGPVAEGEPQKKKRASLKERAQAKKKSKLAEREAGSDDEELGFGVDFKADLRDPRFTVRILPALHLAIQQCVIPM
jgi:hypothetical protein